MNILRFPRNVSAPFHSRYMREPQMAFDGFLRGFTFAAPAIPVISNVTARAYEGDQVRQTLSEQIGNSVQWLESMLFFLNQPEPEFVECGPGSVLSKLLVAIKKKLR